MPSENTEQQFSDSCRAMFDAWDALQAHDAIAEQARGGRDVEAPCGCYDNGYDVSHCDERYRLHDEYVRLFEEARNAR